MSAFFLYALLVASVKIADAEIINIFIVVPLIISCIVTQNSSLSECSSVLFMCIPAVLWHSGPVIVYSLIVEIEYMYYVTFPVSGGGGQTT